MRLSRRKKICYPVFAKFEKHPKRDRKKFNWKFWLLGGFFVLVLAGAVCLFIYSPIFKIKTINVAENRLLAQDQIVQTVRTVLEKKYFKLIPADTIFALAGNKIKNNLLNAFPEIESVEIKRTKVDELTVTLKEREPGGILCLAQAIESTSSSPSAEATNFQEATSTPAVTPTPPPKESLPQSVGCFFVDNTGFVYREAPEISGTLLPTFYSYDQNATQLRAQGVQATSLDFATQAKKELRQAGIDLVGFVFGDEVGPDLKAFTSAGWVIYFDPTRSALAQAKILESLLQDELKDKLTTLQYVDLRVEDRVYYK